MSDFVNFFPKKGLIPAPNPHFLKFFKYFLCQAEFQTPMKKISESRGPCLSPEEAFNVSLSHRLWALVDTLKQVTEIP